MLFHNSVVALSLKPKTLPPGRQLPRLGILSAISQPLPQSPWTRNGIFLVGPSPAHVGMITRALGGAGGVPFAGAGGIPFALPPKPSRCRVIALLMVLLWDRFDGLRRRCLAGEHLIPGMGGRQQQCLETGRKGPFSWLGIGLDAEFAPLEIDELGERLPAFRFGGLGVH